MKIMLSSEKLFSEHGPDIGHDVLCQKVGGREQNLEQGSLGLTS